MMKPRNILFLLLLVFAGIAAWFFFTKKHTESVPKKAGLVVMNLLDKEFYDDCRIKDSVHVPFDELEKFVADLDKEKVEIVVYCSNYMCSTSEHAYKKLVAMGFKHVWMYEGGMAEWYQMGYPVEGTCASSYLSTKLKPTQHHDEDASALLTVQELAQKMNLKVAA